MITIQGKYADAVVFADEVKDNARSQIQELCDQSFVEGSRIRIMPDVHPGKGCVIGLTMTYRDKIVPNLVGVDIGCGIRVLRLAEKRLDAEKLDYLIRRKIPSGFNIRKTPHSFVERAQLSRLRALRVVDYPRAEKSIGTLGGGNHFIEVAQAEDSLYLLIHSGSRHLGKQIAEYYQRVAVQQLGGEQGGRKKRDRRRSLAGGVPRHLAYVEGEALADYVHDVKLVQEYAALNREAMADIIVDGMGWTVEDSFETIHNYVDTESDIIRKGAVSARAGERIVVPLNMRDGSLLCIGKGNADWNFSAPHGAGRIMSRGEARRNISMEEYERSMKGIFSTAVSKSTIDEAPFAYKPMEEILKHIGPAATLLTILKPVYNFKAA